MGRVLTSLAALLGAAPALALAGFVTAGQAATKDPGCLGPTTQAQAQSIIDSRSIHLTDGRVVRMAGIEPFGVVLNRDQEADAALKRSLEAALMGVPFRVAVTADAPDRYGRFSALLGTEANGLVQEWLAREGIAIAFSPEASLPCFARILAAEDEGRRARRGFWRIAKLPWARPEALKSRIGGFAIFQGVALSVGNRRARTYLNFGRRWSEDVTVEINARDRALFGGEAKLAKLAGRRLRIRGFLQSRSGPMMVLRSPLQIEMLDEASDGETP